jgi:hypothetical protein
VIIPNAVNAIVDIRKLKDYCLNPRHEIGRYKARVFASAHDISIENAAELAEILLIAVKSKDAKIRKIDKFGPRYNVDFEWQRGEKKATIRSCWIIKKDTGIPHLTTCFVL